MKKLLVLFIGLFIMVNGAVFAQETDDKDESQDVVTGSVSVSAYSVVPSGGKPGEIQPMQMSGGVDSQVGLSWVTLPSWRICGYWSCYVTGYASSQIVGSVSAITVCVRVNLLKNSADQGGTGQNCIYYATSGGISNDLTLHVDPRGAYWTARSSHVLIRPGFYDNPQLEASASI